MAASLWYDFLMTVENRSASQREAASFRDPSGYVFRRKERLFRAIDDECAGIIRELVESRLLAELIEAGLLVPTRFVDEPDLLHQLKGEHPGYTQFLEHEPIATLTFPYEWSFSALADAALCTLEIQSRLLTAGYSLKDATAYNVQFVGRRPVFIDVSSIEKPARLDIWTAMGQFGQMFTCPLLLCRYRGWDLRSYFLGSLGGRDPEQVAKGIGWFERWRPRYLLDVTLPAMLHHSAQKRLEGKSDLLQRSNKEATAQQFNLRRLRRKIEKLVAHFKPDSHWTDYTQTSSYDDESETSKRSLVADYLKTHRPQRVMDAGSNTGEFSYMAARQGAQVIAADADHDAIELLRRRLKREPAAITPIVLDLCHPSPAIGFLNVERASFFDRLDVDCVLALALIHHLHVSGNLPLASICELFSRMTQRFLMLEFVPTEDEMFQRLRAFRRDLYAGFTLEACKKIFDEKFEILREDAISGSLRTLLLLRKRT